MDYAKIKAPDAVSGAVALRSGKHTALTCGELFFFGLGSGAFVILTVLRELSLPSPDPVLSVSSIV